MELNRKYTEILEKMSKTIDTASTNSQETCITCAITLRQLLELHQKMDHVIKVVDDLKRSDGLNNAFGRG